MAERDRVTRERDDLARILAMSGSQVEKAIAQLPAGTFARSPAPKIIDDAVLVKRIIAAYRASVAMTGQSSSGSFWESTFFNMKRNVHDALISGELAIVQQLLRDPASNDLFYGFDALCASLVPLPMDPDAVAADVSKRLMSLCEAHGVLRLGNPEAAAMRPQPALDLMLTGLEEVLHASIAFPNPFSGEIGISTSRGLAVDRAVQAIYQAARVRSLVSDGARVLEIGGGLGRTAYYTQQFGITDYTIIDLPLSGVAQGYFLGRTLGADAVSLFGENLPGVRVLPPTAFLDSDDCYDLVLNVDSLTEMAPDTARAYCEAIKERAGLFLSINHEANPFTVQELCNEISMRAELRMPYWMRTGYVEELHRLN